MKTITLTQPFASLIAVRAKCFETRSWRPTPPYYGPIAIHASKGFPPEARELLNNDRFSGPLYRAGLLRDDPWRNANFWKALPLGAVVAIGQIALYLPTDLAAKDVTLHASADETYFGDYTPGRWAWWIKRVRILPEPIPAKGSLNFWEWDPPAEVLELVKEV